MKLHINGTDLECTQGDITCQKGFDAVVNAANAELLPGGGVAGAIHRTAGEKLKEACRPLAPISTAEAVITPGFELQNDYVIHVLGQSTRALITQRKSWLIVTSMSCSWQKKRVCIQ